MRIETIQLKGFQDGVECKTSLYSSIESFLPVDFTFVAGNTYALISDFGCGSWGLSTCLLGRGTSKYTGELYLNQKIIGASELSRYACCVAEPIFPQVNTTNNLGTPKECIRRALELSKLPYHVDEIKSKFFLSDNRFERPLEYCSGEIWPISVAINYALGKQVFCFPWLNMITISRFEYFYDSKIIHLLTDEGKIVVVPSSQKKILKRKCDHVIYFLKGKIVYR